MKDTKTVNLYTLSVPSRNNIDFFSSSSNQTLYFRTHEQATLFQKKHYPALSVNQKPELAILDKDMQGGERWLLVYKVEDFDNPQGSSKQHPIINKMHPALENEIKRNPSTVIAVRVREKHDTSTMNYSCACPKDEGLCKKEGHFKVSSSSTTLTYDTPNHYGDYTRFLHVSEQGKWFVEEGPEITLTDASYVLRERDIAEYKNQISQLLGQIEGLKQKIDELQVEQQQSECSAKLF